MRETRRPEAPDDPMGRRYSLFLQATEGSKGDYDSDTILITDNAKLIEVAKRDYGKYLVPTNEVSSLKTARYYTNEQKADLDVKTSVNKIGEIINLSQQLNSLLWERLKCGAKREDVESLYEDICKLAVLSGLEIDRAKKEFVINSMTEINILKDKYKLTDDSRIVKPMFFKMITTENGYKLSDKIHYRYFDTAMDYLQKILARFKFRQSRQRKLKLIPFMDIVKEPDITYRQGFYYSKKDEIIETIVESRKKIGMLYVGYDLKSKSEKEDIKMLASEIKQQCIEDICKKTESDATMYLTLKELDNDENRDIFRYVFEVLFGKPNESFFRLIDDSAETVKILSECKNGEPAEYEFYGIPFRKVNVAHVAAEGYNYDYS